MLTYECPNCGNELKRCGVCHRWLHPTEVKSRNGNEVYCHTCTVILRHIAPPLPVGYVN